jgi:hypothetical protein
MAVNTNKLDTINETESARSIAQSFACIPYLSVKRVE